MAQFNYNPIRNTALALVKKFGRHVECSLLRTVNATPADPNLPWRVGAPTVLEFKFLGIVSTLGFPKLGIAVTDADTDIIIPGDIATTGAVTSPGTLCGDVTTNDRIQSANVQFGILALQDITPDDKTIIYKARCRAWPQLLSTPQTPF